MKKLSILFSLSASMLFPSCETFAMLKKEKQPEQKKQTTSEEQKIKNVKVFDNFSQLPYELVGVIATFAGVDTSYQIINMLIKLNQEFIEQTKKTQTEKNITPKQHPYCVEVMNAIKKAYFCKYSIILRKDNINLFYFFFREKKSDTKYNLQINESPKNLIIYTDIFIAGVQDKSVTLDKNTIYLNFSNKEDVAKIEKRYKDCKLRASIKRVAFHFRLISLILPNVESMQIVDEVGYFVDKEKGLATAFKNETNLLSADDTTIDNILRMAISNEWASKADLEVTPYHFKKIERLVSNILIIQNEHLPQTWAIENDKNEIVSQEHYIFSKAKDNFSLLSPGLLTSFGTCRIKEYIFVADSKKISYKIDEKKFKKYTKQALILIYKKLQEEYKDQKSDFCETNVKKMFVNTNMYVAPLENLDDNFVFYVDINFVKLMKKLNKSFDEILFYKKIPFSLSYENIEYHI